VEHLRPKDHLSGQAILDAAQASGWMTIASRTYECEVRAVPQERLAALIEAFIQAGGCKPPSGDPSGIYLFRSIKV